MNQVWTVNKLILQNWSFNSILNVHIMIAEMLSTPNELFTSLRLSAIVTFIPVNVFFQNLAVQIGINQYANQGQCEIQTGPQTKNEGRKWCQWCYCKNVLHSGHVWAFINSTNCYHHSYTNVSCAPCFSSTERNHCITVVKCHHSDSWRAMSPEC